MMLSGVLVNEGPWSELSVEERAQLIKQLAKLAMLGKILPSTYIRKISENVTIIFEEDEVEEECRDIDWGLLYPISFIFDDTEDMAPPSFTLMPDLYLMSYLNCFIFQA